MLAIDRLLTPAGLADSLARFWDLSASKLLLLADAWTPEAGAPVFTVDGTYTSRAWTDWTLGFLFGSHLLQFDAKEDAAFLRSGLEGTFRHMPPRLTHTGVHDHGFSTVGTYGAILRLIGEGRFTPSAGTKDACELALKVSGAVQAARWTGTADGGGFIHSFNGPHSLFADTMRSLRVLALAHRLGHTLFGEQDAEINLLHRLLDHALTTARYAVFYGEGRDVYDVRGRVAHESVFNIRNGEYRCPGTQQGYSPFTTWMRGLAWVLLGFAEQIEYLDTLDPAEFTPRHQKEEALNRFLAAATAVADYYIASSPSDGIPYWDTGAPGLARMPGSDERPADPFNDFEPVDSSAAAIASQGLLRLGNYLSSEGEQFRAEEYTQAGLTVARRLMEPPYLSEEPAHQGLILHAVYHRPNGWDRVPPGSRVPNGESCIWGDYHARELAVCIGRMAQGKEFPRFFEISQS